MSPDVDRTDETTEDSHRVVWFAPDRPVEGVTVYVRPDTIDADHCPTSEESA